jgi:NifU-like protein
MLNESVHTIEPTAVGASESPADRRAQIESAIAELRPRLQRDGGDIQLIAVDGDMVIVDLKGSCADCALSSFTLAGVRRRLIDLVGRPLRVVPLSAVPVRLESRQ